MKFTTLLKVLEKYLFWELFFFICKDEVFCEFEVLITDYKPKIYTYRNEYTIMGNFLFEYSSTQ